MSPAANYTVHIETRVRRKWALWVAGRFLRLIRFQYRFPRVGDGKWQRSSVPKFTITIVEPAEAEAAALLEKDGES